jgi:hypothetical protein
MLEGQYQNPVRVIGFNTAEHWSDDVSADVARDCGPAAIFKCATSRSFYKILSIASKGGIATAAADAPWVTHSVPAQEVPRQ